MKEHVSERVGVVRVMDFSREELRLVHADLLRGGGPDEFGREALREEFLVPVEVQVERSAMGPEADSHVGLTVASPVPIVLLFEVADIEDDGLVRRHLRVEGGSPVPYGNAITQSRGGCKKKYEHTTPGASFLENEVHCIMRGLAPRGLCAMRNFELVASAAFLPSLQS